MNDNDYLRKKIIQNSEKIKLFNLNNNKSNKIVVKYLENEIKKLIKLIIKNGGIKNGKKIH